MNWQTEGVVEKMKHSGKMHNGTDSLAMPAYRPYGLNLCALLAILVVCGEFVSKTLSGYGVTRGLFLFIFSFHMPLLAFVIGAIGKEQHWGTDKAKRQQTAVWCLAMYVAAKCVHCVQQAFLYQKLTFDLLRESGMPWVFLAAAIWCVMAPFLQNKQPKFVLPAAVLLALAAGYVPAIGDFLAFSRVIVFFPFFLLGWYYGFETGERLAQDRRCKAAGAVILLGAVVLMTVFCRRVYFLRPLFTGRNAYVELGAAVQLGALWRLVSYAIGSVLTAAALATVPVRSLGALTNRIGSRLVAVIFWHRPALAILIVLNIYGIIENRLGWQAARILWMVCALLLAVALAWEPLSRPFAALYHALEPEKSFAGWFDKRYTNLQNMWRSSSKGKKALLYTGAFWFLFTILFFFTYQELFTQGKSFLAHGDGVNQHYPLLVYIARSIRRVFLGILHGRFEMPLFDISLGMGDDIIGFLSSLGRLDPLVLLGALVPVRYSEAFYCFVAIFRVFLAGLAFSYLCRYFKKPVLYTLIGSVIYCFGGYGYSVSIRHPYFCNGLLVLPLLIVGMDKVLKKDKPYLFIFSVMLGFITGWYFFYMMTIMVFVYALVRFFDLYRTDRAREFIKALGRGIGSYLLGIGLAAPVVLPAVVEFSNSARGGHSVYNPTVYSLGYFKSRILMLTAPSSGTGWSYPSLASITFFALVLLLFAKKRGAIKSLAIITLAFFWTSLGNLIMNGFQYPSGRWSFGVTLMGAFVVVEMLPVLMDLTTRQKIICTMAACVYIVLFFSSAQSRRWSYVEVGALFIVATLLILTVNARTVPVSGEITRVSAEVRERRLRAILCLALVMANMGINCLYKSLPDKGNLLASQNSLIYGSTNTALLNAPEREMEPYLLENPQGRVDSDIFTLNWAGVWQIPGVRFYSSVENRNISEYWGQIEQVGLNNGFAMPSSGQNTIAGTLASQKYHLGTQNDSAYVPYGYDLVQETATGNLIYENRYALPWGYTYENTISYDDLNVLNGLEKQEAMLQAVALETAGNTESTALVYDARRIPYETEYSNCEWDGTTLKVLKNNATITLAYEMPANVEGYVRLNSLDLNGSGAVTVAVTVADGRVKRSASAVSDLNGYYIGREDYLFNLGYCEEARTELTITFQTKGTYKLDDIELYALPMDNYPARVEALREEPLENIEWGTNRLSGTVDLSKDKILCVSVPYSKGWTATVDGKKAEILRGNYMFMCLSLTAGHHDIVFSYCSPGLKLGIFITVLSGGLIAIMLYNDHKRKLKSKKGIS